MISELIKQPTMKAIINYIVMLCFILFLKFKLTLLFDV